MKSIMVVLSLLGIVGFGCVPDSFIVEQSAELSTVVALQKMEATDDEAKDVKQIAFQVESVISGDLSNITPDVIKLKVLQAINVAFADSQDRVILLLLADDIADLIIEYIKDRNPMGPIDNQVVVLVKAATKGVQSGVDLYVLSLGGTVVNIELEPIGGAE
jgi:hypothetical protein